MVDNLLSSEEQPIQQPIVTPITPASIPAGIVQPRHVKANYFMVKIGLAANRPTDGTATRFYFATDTFVMSFYDITSATWKSGSAFS